MQTEVRIYKLKPVTPEIQDKLDRSYTESLDLSERELRCPRCQYYIQTLYSDAIGHFKAKCPNCKTVTVYNLAYFRRQKGYGSHKEYLLRRERNADSCRKPIR